MNAALTDLVPHRGRMLLLDRVLTVDRERVETEVRIGPHSLFADAAGVESWVGIEYMAQTVAVLGGWRARLAGQPVRVGYLLGTRRYQPRLARFALGAVLRVSAREEWIMDTGMGRFACAIRAAAEGRLLADAALTVYQPPDGPVAEPTEENG